MYQLQSKAYKISSKNRHRYFPRVLLIFTLLLSFILLVINISQGGQALPYTKVVIEKGDTLWSLALKYNQQNEDPRRLISQIKRLNGLENVVLQPGQEIIIPISGESQ